MTSSVPDLIALWRQQRIKGSALMRGLVGYGQWQVPVSEAAAAGVIGTDKLPALQLSTDTNGKACLLLFSDSDAYNFYRKANAVPGDQHFVTLPGSVVFGAPFAGVEQICVDPLSPHDINYTTENFVSLRACAAALAVEGALSDLRRGQAGDDASRLVRDYGAFSLAGTRQGERPRLLMAPDQKGRTLLAIFTADDAFRAFVPDAARQTGGSDVQRIQVSGKTLFETVRTMRLDGLVFNCSGPVPPIAFSPELAELILEA